MHFTSHVGNSRRILIGIGTAPGLSPGCYIQGTAGIRLGDYSLIGPGVGLISANHDFENISRHTDGGISIGKYCWIGMNAVVLPKVVLGDHTVVAAGAVVTTSFTDGFCLVGGVPARKLKDLRRNNIIEHKNKYEYVGYFPLAQFLEKKEQLLEWEFVKRL
jgi:acetyltransferase-like isoleucine patch superfamily enzyme